MNFFDHKDLGNHLLQICPKVVKHPVYIYIYATVFTWVAPSRQVLFIGKVSEENLKLVFCNNFVMVLSSLPTNVNMTNPVLLLYMLEELGCSCEVNVL
jgi:hypothetical protein